MYIDVVRCLLNENGMLIWESRDVVHKTVFSAMEDKNQQTNRVKGLPPPIVGVFCVHLSEHCFLFKANISYSCIKKRASHQRASLDTPLTLKP